MKYVIILTLLVCQSFQVLSQEPLLQLVDHDHRQVGLTSMHAYQGGILYTAMNDGWPKTELNYIDANNNKIVLNNEIFAEHGMVKYYDQPDGSVHIYMVGLFDYDISIGSIYKFVFDGENLEFIDLNYWDYYNYITDIVVLQDQTIICELYDYLKVDTNGIVTDTLFYSSSLSHQRLFQDNQSNVYMHRRTEVHKLNSQNEFELALNLTDEIEGVVFNDLNELAIMFYDKIVIYDNAFSQELINVSLPENYTYSGGLTYFEQVYYFDLINENDYHSIWTWDKEIGFIKYYEDIVNKITSDFITMDDSRVVMGATFELIKPITFFKEIIQDFDPKNNYINISLDEFKLEYIDKDTSYIDWNYHYAVEFTVTNHGDTDIEYFDVYSDDYFMHPFAFMTPFFSQRIEDLILPGESKTYSGTFDLNTYYLGVDASFEFYIPGANHLLDSDYTDNIISTKLITASDDIIENSDILFYPNPVGDLLYVTGIYEKQNVKFKLMNISGQVVKQGKLEDQTSISLSNLNAGMYIVHVLGEKGISSVRIIKQ